MAKNVRFSKKTHSKIRSKLKLKNRNKSEAIQQFLNLRDKSENTKEATCESERPPPNMVDNKDQMDN